MSNNPKRFRGFPEEAFNFLSELARNNRKEWFEAHRGVYDAAVLLPALSFVERMGEVLQVIAPSVKPDPRVGGSIFRLNRDVRFSVDKSPYKTHVGIRFRDSDTIVSSTCTGPLFYVEFDARSLRLGVGVKEFDPLTLSAYRARVAGRDEIGQDMTVLKEEAARARKDGDDVLGAVLSRPPRGFEDHPDQDLLKRKGFFVRSDSAPPVVIHRKEFVEYCADWFRPYAPVFECLRTVAMSTLAGRA